jgi:hypothetical protein
MALHNDSKTKKSTPQSFFNFQENLNEGINEILTSKFRFDLMHWNVSIDPEKWPIFGRFLTLFPLKRPARREQNTSNNGGDHR